MKPVIAPQKQPILSNVNRYYDVSEMRVFILIDGIDSSQQSRRGMVELSQEFLSGIETLEKVVSKSTDVGL